MKPLDPKARQDLELVAAGAYTPRSDEERTVVLTAKDRLEFDDMLRHQQSLLQKDEPDASSAAEAVAPSTEPPTESAVPFDEWEEFRYVGKDNTLVLFDSFFLSHLLVDVSIPAS